MPTLSVPQPDLVVTVIYEERLHVGAVTGLTFCNQSSSMLLASYSAQDATVVVTDLRVPQHTSCSHGYQARPYATAQLSLGDATLTSVGWRATADAQELLATASDG